MTRWVEVAKALWEIESAGAQPPARTPDPVVTVGAGNPVTEGASARFTLTAAPAPAVDLGVSVTVSESGAVALASALGARTVTIPAGQTSASFTVVTGERRDGRAGRRRRGGARERRRLHGGRRGARPGGGGRQRRGPARHRDQARHRPRGERRCGQVQGAPEPRVRVHGVRGLRDGGRDRAVGRDGAGARGGGLHRGVGRHAHLRAGPDGADGVGAHSRRRHRRGDGVLPAQVLGTRRGRPWRPETARRRD